MVQEKYLEVHNLV